jgi:hypothetical protein
MISPFCVCLCVSPNNFWTNWHIFVNFGKDVVPLRVTSIIWFLIPYIQADVQTPDVDAKFCRSQRGTVKCYMMIYLERMNNFNKTIFVRNQKYERGFRLEFKIRIIFFYEDYTRTVAITGRQMTIGRL